MTLGDAAVGSTVIVARSMETVHKRRIMDMGITKKRNFYPQSSSSGDPVEITVRGYEL